MSKASKSKLQRPMSHWSTEHTRIVSSDGRIGYIPRNQATVPSGIEFFSNMATACLLVYWMTVWGGIFDHVIFGGLLALGLMFHQHESDYRWPLRFVVWGIFWGMYYFGVHWVPMFHFAPLP